MLHLKTVEASKSSKYCIDFSESEERCVVSLGEMLQDRASLFITTPTVATLYAERLFEKFNAVYSRDDSNCELMILNCAEDSKELAFVTDIFNKANEMRLPREGALVAIGGGVCSDIVTIAASMIHRGVAHIRVPTTLIGQVDAAVGIKGGLNFKGVKNFLGCFHPPIGVIITPSFLRSLPLCHLRAGLAEIIKVAIIGDSELFETIMRHWQTLLFTGFQKPSDTSLEVLVQSVAVMLEELSKNIYEDLSYCRRVDFGHTISPILESRCGFELLHGEAVSIDIAFSTLVAERIGLLEHDIVINILSLLAEAGLPTWSPLLSLTLVNDAMAVAKSRRGGQLNMVVPRCLGETVFISERELTEVVVQDVLSILEASANMIPSSETVHMLGS